MLTFVSPFKLTYFLRIYTGQTLPQTLAVRNRKHRDETDKICMWLLSTMQNAQRAEF